MKISCYLFWLIVKIVRLGNAFPTENAVNAVGKSVVENMFQLRDSLSKVQKGWTAIKGKDLNRVQQFKV